MCLFIIGCFAVKGVFIFIFQINSNRMLVLPPAPLRAERLDTIPACPSAGVHAIQLPYR